MKPAMYIEVLAEPRYWEDAEVNGQWDNDGSLIPFRIGDEWRPVIRLADGMVLDWPPGMVAKIYYKVCDQGMYWLQDADRKRVAKWAGHYVPNDFLCHGDNGFGDYILMNIGADGMVVGWTPPIVNPARWVSA